MANMAVCSRCGVVFDAHCEKCAHEPGGAFCEGCLRARHLVNYCVLAPREGAWPARLTVLNYPPRKPRVGKRGRG